MNSTTACEDDILQISCNASSVIHIISSMYGRMDRLTCSTENPSSSGSTYYGCQETDGLSVVKQNCEGHQNCSLLVRPENFGLDGSRWCEYMSDKYLKVTYGCVNGRLWNNRVPYC